MVSCLSSSPSSLLPSPLPGLISFITWFMSPQSIACLVSPSSSLISHFFLESSLFHVSVPPSISCFSSLATAFFIYSLYRYSRLSCTDFSTKSWISGWISAVVALGLASSSSRELIQQALPSSVSNTTVTVCRQARWSIYTTKFSKFNKLETFFKEVSLPAHHWEIPNVERYLTLSQSQGTPSLPVLNKSFPQI